MSFPILSFIRLDATEQHGNSLVEILLTHNHKDGAFVNFYSEGLHKNEIIWTAIEDSEIFVTVKHIFGETPYSENVQINDKLIRSKGYILRDSANQIAKKIESYFDEELS